MKKQSSKGNSVRILGEPNSVVHLEKSLERRWIYMLGGTELEAGKDGTSTRGLVNDAAVSPLSRRHRSTET